MIKSSQLLVWHCNFLTHDRVTLAELWQACNEIDVIMSQAMPVLFADKLLSPSHNVLALHFWVWYTWESPEKHSSLYCFIPLCEKADMCINKYHNIAFIAQVLAAFSLRYIHQMHLKTLELHKHLHRTHKNVQKNNDTSWYFFTSLNTLLWQKKGTNGNVNVWYHISGTLTPSHRSTLTHSTLVFIIHYHRYEWSRRRCAGKWDIRNLHEYFNYISLGCPKCQVSPSWKCV